ncbi:MAG: hypothetical protein RLZ12_22, partial [Bacillota bacterium]
MSWYKKNLILLTSISVIGLVALFVHMNSSLSSFYRMGSVEVD